MAEIINTIMLALLGIILVLDIAWLSILVRLFIAKPKKK